MNTCPSPQVGIFLHAGEKSAYVVEQGNQALRKVAIGELSFTVATSAATGAATGPTIGAAALAGAAAAWLAWRRVCVHVPRGVGRTARHVC